MAKCKPVMGSAVKRAKHCYNCTHFDSTVSHFLVAHVTLHKLHINAADCTAIHTGNHYTANFQRTTSKWCCSFPTPETSLLNYLAKRPEICTYKTQHILTLSTVKWCFLYLNSKRQTLVHSLCTTVRAQISSPFNVFLPIEDGSQIQAGGLTAFVAIQARSLT